jgi:hypothetical protein
MLPSTYVCTVHSSKRSFPFSANPPSLPDGICNDTRKMVTYMALLKNTSKDTGK